jgi:hypothetical protein
MLSGSEALLIAAIIMGAALFVQLTLGIVSLVALHAKKRKNQTNESEKIEFSLRNFFKKDGFSNVSEKTLIILFFVNWIIAMIEAAINLSRKVDFSESELGCKIASLMKLSSYALAKICNYLFLACKAAIVHSAIEAQMNWKVEFLLKLTVIAAILLTFVIVPLSLPYTRINEITRVCTQRTVQLGYVLVLFPLLEFINSCFLLYMFAKPLWHSKSDKLRSVYRNALISGSVVIILSQILIFMNIWMGQITGISFPFVSLSSVELLINMMFQMFSLSKVLGLDALLCMASNVKKNLIRISHDNEPSVICLDPAK